MGDRTVKPIIIRLLRREEGEEWIGLCFRTLCEKLETP
jgi:hypothetical protein